MDSEEFLFIEKGFIVNIRHVMKMKDHVLYMRDGSEAVGDSAGDRSRAENSRILAVLEMMILGLNTLGIIIETGLGIWFSESIFT